MAKYLDPKADIKTLHIPTSLMQDANVSKAIELVRESAYSEAEILAIDRYWDAVSRERTALSEKLEQGIAQGIAIGEERGIAKERLESEKRQEQERIANISRMRSKGYSIEVIADLLDLTPEYVQLHC